MTHPDTDVLADFRAGLVTGRRAAVITAHLADCPRCAAVADELAGIPVLLAAVPAPAMPDRVAQRLDAVLAAEVAQRDESERARGTRRPDPVHPATRPVRTGNGGWRWMSPRVLAPAGVVAVLVAAGGYFLSSHGSSPQLQGASSAAAPAGAQRAAGSASKALAEPPAGTGPKSRRMSPADFVVVVSPVDFQAGTLTRQLEADLRVPETARTTRAATATVRACVQDVAGRAAVVRVESAHFEGQPVTVVVTRASQADRVQLAGPGCSATGSHVLATRTVPAGISGP